MRRSGLLSLLSNPKGRHGVFTGTWADVGRLLVVFLWGWGVLALFHAVFPSTRGSYALTGLVIAGAYLFIDRAFVVAHNLSLE